jgi:hypothetical protein
MNIIGRYHLQWRHQIWSSYVYVRGNLHFSPPIHHVEIHTLLIALMFGLEKDTSRNWGSNIKLKEIRCRSIGAFLITINGQWSRGAGSCARANCKYASSIAHGMPPCDQTPSTTTKRNVFRPLKSRRLSKIGQTPRPPFERVL